MYKEKEMPLLDEDVEKYFGDTNIETYNDEKIQLVKKAKILLEFWSSLSLAITRSKEGYHLSKKWGDDELKKRYIEEGRPLIKKIIILEDDLKQILPNLKGVNFLTPSEINILPKWVLKILEI